MFLGLALAPYVSADGLAYRFERMWPPQLAQPWYFNFPGGVALGPDGRVYVADTGNHQIQVYEPDGTFVRAWGTLGTGAGEFDEPEGIAIDSAGRVYVTEQGNNRVQVFEADGRFVTTWGELGSDALTKGNCSIPCGPRGGVLRRREGSTERRVARKGHHSTRPLSGVCISLGLSGADRRKRQTHYRHLSGRRLHPYQGRD